MMSGRTLLPKLSVILCTHNPRQESLTRTLRALENQTLPQAEWELLLIDNASVESVAGRFDLTWHADARHLSEKTPGLTPARRRGMTESAGDLLVFVDDDNVLDGRYLETALEIAVAHPTIGAFGGSIAGEFETTPPPWILPYFTGLVVQELNKDYWGNSDRWSLATPYGAGLCVRRNVADDYLQKLRSTPLRCALDRTGNQLGAGGDSDLAWCAIDIGMGTGRFCRLRLTHLIPATRLTRSYIVALYAGFASADVVLSLLRPPDEQDKQGKIKQAIKSVFRYLRGSKVERSIMNACRRARNQTTSRLRELQINAQAD